MPGDPVDLSVWINAETDAVPATADVSVTLATPFASVRTCVVCDNVPKVVEKVTHTPAQLATWVPLTLSCTVMVEVDRAGRVVGLATRVD